MSLGKVSNDAVRIAKATLRDVYRHNTHERLAAESRAYVVLIGEGLDLRDLPEIDCPISARAAEVYEDFCGLMAVADYPFVAVFAGDLDGTDTGECGYNVLYHELGHLVQYTAVGCRQSPPGERCQRILDLYRAATENEFYDDTYARTNSAEYFAEGTQLYFDGGTELLKKVDPGLYGLLREIYRP